MESVVIFVITYMIVLILAAIVIYNAPDERTAKQTKVRKTFKSHKKKKQKISTSEFDVVECE